MEEALFPTIPYHHFLFAMLAMLAMLSMLSMLAMRSPPRCCCCVSLCAGWEDRCRLRSWSSCLRCSGWECSSCVCGCAVGEHDTLVACRGAGWLHGVCTRGTHILRFFHPAHAPLMCFQEAAQRRKEQETELRRAQEAEQRWAQEAEQLRASAAATLARRLSALPLWLLQGQQEHPELALRALQQQQREQQLQEQWSVLQASAVPGNEGGSATVTAQAAAFDEAQKELFLLVMAQQEQGLEQQQCHQKEDSGFEAELSQLVQKRAAAAAAAGNMVAAQWEQLAGLLPQLRGMEEQAETLVGEVTGLRAALPAGDDAERGKKRVRGGENGGRRSKRAGTEVLQREQSRAEQQHGSNTAAESEPGGRGREDALPAEGGTVIRDLTAGWQAYSDARAEVARIMSDAVAGDADALQQLCAAVQRSTDLQQAEQQVAAAAAALPPLLDAADAHVRRVCVEQRQTVRNEADARLQSAQQLLSEVRQALRRAEQTMQQLEALRGRLQAHNDAQVCLCRPHHHHHVFVSPS